MSTKSTRDRIEKYRPLGIDYGNAEEDFHHRDGNDFQIGKFLQKNFDLEDGVFLVDFDQSSYIGKKLVQIITAIGGKFIVDDLSVKTQFGLENIYLVNIFGNKMCIGINEDHREQIANNITLIAEYDTILPIIALIKANSIKNQ